MASAFSSRSAAAFARSTAGTGGRISPALRPYYAPRLLVASVASYHAPQYSYIRSLHTTRAVRQPTPSTSSKDVATASSSSEKAVATSTSTAKKGTRLQRIWASVKKEASHYWHGTKLLGKEIRISARIQGRLLAGKKLTRRERRQVSSYVHQSTRHSSRDARRSSSARLRTCFD